MAWGYWSAHALPPSSRVEQSSSPVPILRSRSRDQSLERDRREREQSAFPTPVRSSAVGSSTASVSTAHHHRIGNSSSPDTDLDYRTRSERGTLPRGKSIDGVDWVPERNTLPRGKSDCDSSWTERGLVRGKSDNDWGTDRASSRNAGKSGSEGDWCPACSSGSRVSFQSVKGSGEGSSGAEGGKGSSNILSSSLPTPPPPPFQASYSQPSLNTDARIHAQHHQADRRHSGDRGVIIQKEPPSRMTAVDRGVTMQTVERRSSTAQQLILKPQQPQPRVERRMSIDRRGDQPMDRRGDQPMDRRGDQPMDRRGDQPIDRRGDQPMDRRGDQPMDRKDDQLMDKIETYSLRREKEDRKKPRETRNSYSSHDSHKSSLSQRSSEEENNETTVYRHPPNGRREHKVKSHTLSYTRTPSSERQFESYSEACSKEGSSDGYICRYSGCMVSSSSRADTDSRLTHHSSLKSKTPRGSRESHVSEDSRSLRHSSTGSAEEEKRPLPLPPPPCRSSTTSGKNSVFSDDVESPKEWKTFRDKDSKKLRSVETMHSNGAHVYRSSKGRTVLTRDTAASLPRRTLRSITPDNESISFHDSIGREVSKRRRARRRSASVSSRCEETECERDGRQRNFSKRLDFAQSNQSIHATSSRNSSSKSEKSSSRSSRSPSVEIVRKGCNSLKCRGRNLR